MSAPAIGLEILGASFFATHHVSAERALAGAEREATSPAFALLVGRARRFTSLVTQLHMEVLGALSPRIAGLPVVFATCHGEIQAALKMITDFREHGLVSSAQFALSVHNTPSGLYAAATGNTAPTTTLTGENAVAAGWLEAALIARETGGLVVLSIADEPVPPAFHGPAERGGVAAAFLLQSAGPEPGAAGMPAELTIAAARGETERPLRLLSRAVKAFEDRAADDIALGCVLAEGAVRLRLGS